MYIVHEDEHKETESFQTIFGNTIYRIGSLTPESYYIGALLSEICCPNCKSILQGYSQINQYNSNDIKLIFYCDNCWFKKTYKPKGIKMTKVKKPKQPKPKVIEEPKKNFKCPTENGFPVDPNYAPLSWQDSSIIDNIEKQKYLKSEKSIIDFMYKIIMGAIKAHKTKEFNKETIMNCIAFCIRNPDFNLDLIIKYQFENKKKEEFTRDELIELILIHSISINLLQIFHIDFVAPTIKKEAIENLPIAHPDGKTIGELFTDEDNRSYKWNGKIWVRNDNVAKKVKN